MKIASRNKFSRFINKKVRYHNSGTALKKDLSNTEKDQLLKIFKPTGIAALSYDHRVIAGAAL